MTEDRPAPLIDILFSFFWKTIYRRVALPSFMEYRAQTEFGGLRKVPMHRPTEKLKRMTPVNKDACPFRDVVYWREFQREHYAFTDVLRGD